MEQTLVKLQAESQATLNALSRVSDDLNKVAFPPLGTKNLSAID
jgi:hypothetical protein